MSTLVGNATRLGIQCGESMAGLSPFQVELYRRLWWHIVPLDVRVTEDNHLDPIILEPTFITQFPLNINDSKLDPHMVKNPDYQQYKTEMCFSLIRLRVSNCARRLLFSDGFAKLNGYPVLPTEQKCQMLRALESFIEARHLSQCDEGVPLDVVPVMATRLIIDRLKLVARRPMYGRNHGRDLINSERRMICLDFVRRARTLRQYDRGKSWLWLSQSYIEWDAFAYLLLEVCLTPSVDNSDRMWDTVDDAINEWKLDPDACHDRRCKHIEELYSRATAVKNGLVNMEFSTDGTGASLDQEDGCISQPAVLATRANQNHAPDAQYTRLKNPTAGTACEWSSSIFETYWEVAGSAKQGHTFWD
jgi:hypothetical protein